VTAWFRAAGLKDDEVENSVERLDKWYLGATPRFAHDFGRTNAENSNGDALSAVLALFDDAGDALVSRSRDQESRVAPSVDIFACTKETNDDFLDPCAIALNMTDVQYRKCAETHEPVGSVLQKDGKMAILRGCDETVEMSGRLRRCSSWDAFQHAVNLVNSYCSPESLK
jgi:hypothetical protein